MRKKKHYIALLLFVCLMAGCQSPTTTPESIATILETNCETEVPSIPETVEPEETAPGVDHYEAYQWMVNLHAEDVAFVEFIYLTDPSVSYRRYEGEEIQEVIDLFQAKKCLEYMDRHPVYEYAPTIQWPGYFTAEFHVVMKDGTAHTVCSVYSVATVIDGTGFHTFSDWLNHFWPESGNAPLPENWAQEVAGRNYHTASDSVSTLSTTVHETERANLDYSFDTDVAFGSLSRHYPIGRGGIELSASGASKTGVTLSTYWTGTSGLTQLHISSQYWLEKWQEDSGSYIALEDWQYSCASPQEFASDNTRHWYISSAYPLEPGHYRVGMTFYEKYNGSIQNETICYAKFSIVP